MAAGKVDWGSRSTLELVEKLARSGLDVDRSLVEELLGRGAAVVPYLAQILDDDKYWRLNEKTLGSGWAPINALHLLGAIADPTGLEPILRVLHNRPDDLGDWLTEEVPSILACFGPAAIEPSKKLVSNRNLDVYVRVAGSVALSLIARLHPDSKDDVIDFFHAVLVREREDKEFLSLCVDDLAELKDPRSKPILRSLFESGRIDEESITWEDIEEIYRTSIENLPHHEKKDPMMHFSPENLSYLKRITGKPWSENEDQTTASWPELKPTKKVGRNDPCPCGSGNKYKKCCLPKTRSSQKIDEDERGLRQAILEFANAERFAYDLKSAFAIYRKGLEDSDFEEPEEEITFIDWFIHDYPCAGSGEPVIKIFAKEKASTLNERQRRILKEWQNTLFGVYEVIEILKGRGVRLRDIVTEEKYFVEDVSASNAAAMWDLLAARIISVDGALHLSGAATLLPQRRKRDLKDFLQTRFMDYKRTHKEASFREFLHAESHTIIQYASQKQMPILTTIEGDELCLARALYELKDREAAKRILDEMEEFQSKSREGDDAIVYNWLEAEPPANQRSRCDDSGGFEEHRLLGTVTLTRDTLELECLSKKRLYQLKELMEGALKSTIKYLADLSVDAKTALERLRDRPEKETPSLPRDEERKVTEEYLNRYYLEKWINMKIPALHNRTPKQAMKTEEGKTSLTQLLSEMQNLQERLRRHGEPYFNVDRLRRKLGLPTLKDMIRRSAT